jgi:hypothetical protein
MRKTSVKKEFNMAIIAPPGTRETNQKKPYGVYDRTPAKTNWVWIALLALLVFVLLFFWMS